MAEPEADRLRLLEQARRAAAEFARGRDGTRFAPPEIGIELGAWTRRLELEHRKLDEEGWLIGMLTLVCLTRQRCTERASSLEEQTSASLAERSRE